MKTKTITIAFALIFVAAFFQVGAQSLFDNEYALKAIELETLAQTYFDSGEYDLAAETASQAFDNWVLSDQYVVESLNKMADEDTIRKARLAAENEAANAEAEAERLRLEEEEAARLAEAEKLRLDEEEAARLAAEQQRLEDEENARAEAAEAEAAMLASEAERLAAEEAARLAAEESALQALMLQAEEALKQAKDRVVWAESVSAKENYPAAWESASSELTAGLASYDEGDFIRAKWHAEAVIAALADVGAENPLPAIYVVRLIPEKRDCFWYIAGYPFIYNDPTQWTKIYEANKAKIQDPNNPNLIQPGQVFVIPSLKGELRQGEWDSGKQYKSLD